MSKGVQRIFSQVSHTYETINHLLTFGLDVFWRRKASRLAAKGGGKRWLDVCSGTGETAAYLQKHANGRVSVVTADFSLPMIRVAANKHGAKQIAMTLADAKQLPYPDNTFDLVIISFATRNINKSREGLLEYLREFRRVLKSGGRFINLETSQPESRFIRWLFHLYIRMTVKPLGSLISGSKSGYAYLSYTVPRFYSTEQFARILTEAGFRNSGFEPMTLGLAAIHWAKKP
ncbi:MAG: ubiquinone/menaquinone biosynthesis methyltransferase [Candidatus Thorarchaeota archaeon]|jgi:demethylmenaquinone methyltransferase/2-methoxy-6-polyprenyl-1,4-benzoquinol methylase